MTTLFSTLPNDRAAEAEWAVGIWVPYEHLAADNSRLKPVRTRTGATMILNPSYKAKREAIRTLARVQWTEGRYGGPVAALVRCSLPPHSRADITNWNKILWDALEGVIVKDDRQFVDVRIVELTRSERDEPGAFIEVWPVE